MHAIILLFYEINKMSALAGVALTPDTDADELTEAAAKLAASISRSSMRKQIGQEKRKEAAEESSGKNSFQELWANCA